MPPITSQAATSSATASAASLLASFKGSFNLAGAEDQLFSQLLASSSFAQPTAPRTDAVRTSTTSSPSSSDTSVDITASGDDRAALRTLLQRLRDDAQALRDYSRKRDAGDSSGKDDQHAKAASSADAKKADASDRDATSGPVRPDSAKKTKTGAATSTTNDDTDQGTDTIETDAASGTAVVTPVVVDATVVTQAATDQDGGKSADSQADATEPTADMAALLADFLRTEKAALALLDKLRRAKGDGETSSTTVENDSASMASSDTTALLEAVGGVSKPGASDAQQALQRFLDQADTAKPTTAAGDDGGDGALAAFENFHKALTQGGAKDSQEGTATTPTRANKTAQSENHASTASPANATDTPAEAPRIVADALVEKVASAAKIVTGGDDAVTGVSQAGRTTEANPLAGAAPTSKTGALYDAASQLSATRATRGGAAGLPSVVEQVSVILHKQVKDGQSEITIQLKPAELGKIEVKLTFSDDGHVQGKVVAENAATLTALTKDQDHLYRALQEAGLRADPGSLQFSLRGDQQNPFAGDPNAGQGQGSSSTFQQNALGDVDAETGVAAIDDVLAQWYVTPGRVNLKV